MNITDILILVAGVAAVWAALEARRAARLAGKAADQAAVAADQAHAARKACESIVPAAPDRTTVQRTAAGGPGPADF